MLLNVTFCHFRFSKNWLHGNQLLAYNNNTMKQNAINYRSLLAAVINRAIEDLKETGQRMARKEPDRAMAFILSETCETYCLYMDINYEAVKERAAALYRRVIEQENKCPLFSDTAKKRRGRPRTVKPVRNPYPSPPINLTSSKKS